MDSNKEPQIFSDYALEQSGTHAVSRRFMANVFLWMGGALGISTLFAFLFAANPEWLVPMFTNTGLSALGWLVMLAPLGFVMLMSFGYQRLSATALTALFILYAAINGISLSFILLVYTQASWLSWATQQIRT
jgi:hypothetical protein